MRVVNVEDVLNNSNVLNNVLHDADINLLSDLLDNSLNDLNVEILNDALNANNVAIADVVAVNVLSGGEVILFTR